MKINPEIANIINIVKKENEYQKKTQDEGEQKQKVADIISVENKEASHSQVENVEEAKELLSDVMREMENSSAEVHNLNQYRISQLIS